MGISSIQVGNIDLDRNSGDGSTNSVHDRWTHQINQRRRCPTVQGVSSVLQFKTQIIKKVKRNSQIIKPKKNKERYNKTKRTSKRVGTVKEQRRRPGSIRSTRSPWLTNVSMNLRGSPSISISVSFSKYLFTASISPQTHQLSRPNFQAFFFFQYGSF